MEDISSNRTSLARHLLLELKATLQHINRLSSDIGDSSGSVLGKVYEDHLDKIREKVGQFNGNVARVKAIHQEITKALNEWHDYITDDREITRISFPFKLIKKRKETQKKIQSLKDEISSILIRNRLMREDIVKLESDLEHEATQRLHKDVRYEDYAAHLKYKSELVEELRYLLSTLPGMPIKELNLDNLDTCLTLLS